MDRELAGRLTRDAQLAARLVGQVVDECRQLGLPPSPTLVGASLELWHLAAAAKDKPGVAWSGRTSSAVEAREMERRALLAGFARHGVRARLGGADTGRPSRALRPVQRYGAYPGTAGLL